MRSFTLFFLTAFLSISERSEPAGLPKEGRFVGTLGSGKFGKTFANKFGPL